jgi:hypothetical protein
MKGSLNSYIKTINTLYNMSSRDFHRIDEIYHNLYLKRTPMEDCEDKEDYSTPSEFKKYKKEAVYKMGDENWAGQGEDEEAGEEDPYKASQVANNRVAQNVAICIADAVDTTLIDVSEVKANPENAHFTVKDKNDGKNYKVTVELAR